MSGSSAISVRISDEAQRLLQAAAREKGAVGISGLAREVLEAWAKQYAARSLKESTRVAVSFLRSHNGEWGDDPETFFPMPPAQK